MDHPLGAVPEDWQRMLAVVAHPDDLEYGAASAVARWTKAGKWVGYVVVTNGEAGIDGLPPEEAGPIRMAEQEHSAKIVGVDDVRFLRLPRRRHRAGPQPPPGRGSGDPPLAARRAADRHVRPHLRVVARAAHRQPGRPPCRRHRHPRRSERRRQPMDLPRAARRRLRALARCSARVRDGLQRTDPRRRRHRHPRRRCRVAASPPRPTSTASAETSTPPSSSMA